MTLVEIIKELEEKLQVGETHLTEEEAHMYITRAFEVAYGIN